MLKEQLKQLGLNQSEILVYLDLLENGISTPSIVSRRTKIARTNCYHVLSALLAKDLIREEKLGAKKSYLPHDPQSLLIELDRKKELVNEILPDLRGIFTTQKNKPKVAFYDGLDQIKQIYLASLDARKVFGMTSLNRFLEAYPEFGVYYAEELKRRGIFLADVLSHSSTSGAAEQLKSIIGPYYDYRSLGTKYESFPTDILIWDDSVAMITFDDPPFGTILKSKTLANTYKMIHEVMWNSTN